MVFKSNFVLIEFSLLVFLMIFSEVAARDMPALPSHPLLKSNEAQSTAGSLNDPIKPQFLQAMIPIVADLAINYCIECKCCIPE
uniref:HT-like protein n=1 Tax=Nicotiana langsdorffii TaxID=118700 RepID=B1Q4J3_NICLA|nr:HT-like protein [Nicotiana langsdorffii]